VKLGEVNRPASPEASKKDVRTIWELRTMRLQVQYCISIVNRAG
jgi:hypothetical protein